MQDFCFDIRRRDALSSTISELGGGSTITLKAGGDHLATRRDASVGINLTTLEAEQKKRKKHSYW